MIRYLFSYNFYFDYLFTTDMAKPPPGASQMFFLEAEVTEKASFT